MSNAFSPPIWIRASAWAVVSFLTIAASAVAIRTASQEAARVIPPPAADASEGSEGFPDDCVVGMRELTGNRIFVAGAREAQGPHQHGRCRPRAGADMFHQAWRENAGLVAQRTQSVAVLVTVGHDVHVAAAQRLAELG